MLLQCSSVNNWRKGKRNRSKGEAAEQEEPEADETLVVVQDIWLQCSYPRPWPRPTHICERYSRTHPLHIVGSLILPLWPKHPDALLLGPIRPSSRRARHSRLHLLIRHRVLDIGPDKLTYLSNTVTEFELSSASLMLQSSVEQLSTRDGPSKGRVYTCTPNNFCKGRKKSKFLLIIHAYYTCK